MSSAVETELAPAVLIGHCTTCQHPYRVEIPADIAERFGPRMRHAMGYVLKAAGITLPACGCPNRSVRFAPVRVAYKAEKACGGSCWTAKSVTCTCSCNGKNHGGAHTNGGF